MVSLKQQKPIATDAITSSCTVLAHAHFLPERPRDLSALRVLKVLMSAQSTQGTHSRERSVGREAQRVRVAAGKRDDTVAERVIRQREGKDHHLPSPGADVAGVSQSWRRCGRGEPSPGAEVAGVSPVMAQMWQG